MLTLSELQNQLQSIQTAEAVAVQAASTTAALDEVRRGLFGKKAPLALILRSLGELSSEDRPAAGKLVNETKEALQQILDERVAALKGSELNASLEAEAVDITLPGCRPCAGTLHPLTQILREMEDIFTSMGFTIELGPDIEDDFHNFEALNLGVDHPARDTHDTFYLSSDLLLRTHTSPVQVRTMLARKPPLAIIAPGKVYRCDSDVTHSPMFHQVEGLMVDTNIRFSDLKGVLETFIRQMFGPNTQYRLRPSFFPFTEPSAEIDILFERRHPNGHMVRDWLEILGSGMVHPKVLENCEIDPDKYTGFAFGMGVERIAMLKYGVNAIGHFFENDMRFLRQFQ